jgi:hypothetical protein
MKKALHWRDVFYTYTSRQGGKKCKHNSGKEEGDSVEYVG